MRIKKSPLLIVSLCLMCLALLSGCERWNTATPWPSSTPRPTKTSTPTIVPSATVTPTPTSVPIARAGTPLPVAGRTIDASTAAELKPVAHWGQGIPQALTFSPDGSLLALASTRGMYLYNGRNLSPVRAIEPGFGFRCLAFSTDGSRIAAGGDDGKIYLYQTQDGTLAGSFTAHTGPVFALAVSPDGQWIASSGWDNAIQLWKAETGEQSRSFSGNLAPARRLAFSQDGKRLFGWSSRDQVLNWDTASGKAGQAVYVGIDSHNHSGSSGAFSAEGAYFVADQDTRARAAILASGNTLVQINQSSPLLQVAISAGGEFIAGAAEDGLKIWKGQGGGLVRQFSSPAGVGAFDFLTFSPDSSLIASAGDTLRLWRIDQPEDAPAVSGPATFAMDFRLKSVFSPDGSEIRQLLPDGQMQSFRLADGAPRLASGVAAGASNVVALSQDGSLMATGGSDNKIGLWKVASGERLFTFKGPTAMPSALAFSPDGSLVASGGADGVVFVWESANGAQATTLEAEDKVLQLAFSPDGKRLAVGTPGKTLFWQVSDWTSAGELPGRDVVFAPKGNLLALVDDQQATSVVNLYGQDGNQALQSLAVYGNSMAFSPDGSLLAVSGSEISLWKTEDGEQVADVPLPVSHGQVNFSPDGKTLALTSWDGVVYLWAAP